MWVTVDIHCHLLYVFDSSRNASVHCIFSNFGAPTFDSTYCTLGGMEMHIQFHMLVFGSIQERYMYNLTCC